MKLPAKIQTLIDCFEKIPGVGSKTALRQVLAISRWAEKDLLKFGESLKTLYHLKKCCHCGFFSEENTCKICLDSTRREESSLCIVETISDYMAVESSQKFKGCYHILGGVLNPLLNVGPDQLSIDLLMKRIRRDGVKKIIFAINPSLEGDATCSYLKEKIDPSIHVQRIGFGVPVGGNLEYLDALTISKALEYARDMD